MQKIISAALLLSFSTIVLSAPKWELIYSENEAPSSDTGIYLERDSIQADKITPELTRFNLLFNFKGKFGESSLFLVGLVDCENRLLGFDSITEYSKLFAQGTSKPSDEGPLRVLEPAEGSIAQPILNQACK